MAEMELWILTTLSLYGILVFCGCERFILPDRYHSILIVIHGLYPSDS
jgi:hypothetical protein